MILNVTRMTMTTLQCLHTPERLDLGGHLCLKWNDPINNRFLQQYVTDITSFLNSKLTILACNAKRMVIPFYTRDLQRKSALELDFLSDGTISCDDQQHLLKSAFLFTQSVKLKQESWCRMHSAENIMGKQAMDGRKSQRGS